MRALLSRVCFFSIEISSGHRIKHAEKKSMIIQISPLTLPRIYWSYAVSNYNIKMECENCEGAEKSHHPNMQQQQ